MPQVGNTIPDHLRASIMRLVQSQEEEAEELERALKEAHGGADEGGEEEARAVRVIEGEESGDEDGDKVVVSFFPMTCHFGADISHVEAATLKRTMSTSRASSS